MDKIKFEDISREIIKMGKEDQKCRLDLQSWEENKKMIEELDMEHTKSLKTIIADIELPTISKVGKKAALYAWLIAQHSPDKKFRAKYLTLMKKHLDDIDPINLAMMQDRVNMENGKPQIYGTQFQQDKSGVFVLWKVRDGKNLDTRRIKLGLSPIAEYVKKIAKSYKREFRV